MAEILGPREAAVVREITKMYEESRRDTLPNLVTHYKEEGAPKGEIVIVIAPPGEKAVSDSEIEAMLCEALKTASVRDAAAQVAEMTGIPRKKAYEFAIILTKGGKGA
jgi:16S rRNA (cytidine1402-2'-O)-methyltransferase